MHGRDGTMTPKRRIEDYFLPKYEKSKSDASRCLKVTFLDLPFHLRRQIYIEAGFVKGADGSDPSVINLNSTSQVAQTKNFDGCRWHPQFITPELELLKKRIVCGSCLRRIGYHLDQYECNCIYFATQLLYTSRQILTEVREVMYSENKFTISRSDVGGLSALEKLSTSALASLRWLTIRLNYISCDDEDKCRDRDHRLDCHPTCKEYGHDHSLGEIISREDKQLVADWERVSDLLAAHIQPHQLDLTLICDTKTLDTAEVIAGKLSKLPPLKACLIRLARKPNQAIRQLCETTALRAMGYPESRITAPFPFRTLPGELQLRILEQTDLIAPLHFARGLPYISRGEKQFRHMHARPCSRLFEYADDRDYFCSRQNRHSAFGPACECWQPPTSLFMVDREMREDARRIFHSRNDWVIHWPAYYSFSSYCPGATLRAFFCKTIIKHLRYVQLCVAGFQMSSGWESTWNVSLETLASEAMLSMLTLVIRLPHPQHILTETVADHISAPRAWSQHKVFVESLKRLRGVKDLFLFVAHRHDLYPLPWPSENLETCRNSEEFFHAQAQAFEKQIMGEGYDSVARGKFKRAHILTVRRDELHDWCADCSVCGESGLPDRWVSLVKLPLSVTRLTDLAKEFPDEG